jgi:hypothetical protein
VAPFFCDGCAPLSHNGENRLSERIAMKTGVTGFLLLCALGSGGGACGDGDGGDDVPTTLGGICNDVAESTCQAAVKCSQDLSMSTCVQTYRQRCCNSDGDCRETVSRIDPTEYARCRKDLAAMSCTDIQNDTTPNSCSVM